MDAGLSAPAPPEVLLPDRLAAVRRQMKRQGLHGVLVRSADRFLNEYVPPADSVRQWLTGFTGSMGEAFVTEKEAFIAVDGRYWLQVERELPPGWTVLKVPLGTALEMAIADQVRDWVKATRRKLRLGVNPERITPAQWERYRRLHPRLVVKPACPLQKLQPKGTYLLNAKHWEVSKKEVGLSTEEKLAMLAPALGNIDGLVVQRLDEIAWLANLRGSFFPYQATFPAVAIVTKGRLWLGSDRIPDAAPTSKAVSWVSMEALWSKIGMKGLSKLGLDADANTMAARLSIEAAGGCIIPLSSPIPALRAQKTPAELRSMKEAFQKADSVVASTIQQIQTSIDRGEIVTERGFAAAIEDNFFEAGAVSLSFKVISAFSKSGAQIHYGSPSPRKRLKPGQLMLVDCGAYFHSGYATDLTRTFLVGKKAKPTDEQKRRFTLVLKAAIAGMKAILPLGSKGMQLDAIVRAPLWAAGLDYNHGTGHGVGINVHEYPPRVGQSSQTVLEPGHVFSIEPGLYDPKFGGIRIENLCTLEEGPPGFMRVVPLTFCPLDERLIDKKALTPDERAFLAHYRSAENRL